MSSEQIEIDIVELPRDMGKTPLVHGFLRFRKAVFVDRMAWPLHHADGVEFEQYDSFSATAYVVAHRNGQIVGGARLKRTDASFCTGTVQYSYMIRDAHLGLLDGMPPELCFDEPPVEKDTWELTRFAAEQVQGLAEAILDAANDFLFDVGARECLFLGPPAFLRMATRLGWHPKPLGDVVENRDGRFLAFSCRVRGRERQDCTAAYRSSNK